LSLIGSGFLSTKDIEESGVPDMWSWAFIGLYCQYAAVGLLYGSYNTEVAFANYIENSQALLVRC